MLEQIAKVKAEAESYVISDHDSLENFRLEFLVKKGKVQSLFSALKLLPNDQKRSYGATLNDLKNFVESKFVGNEAILKGSSLSKISDIQDLTLSVVSDKLGSVHPLTQVLKKITDIFIGIGYDIADGPEIDDDWHNFSALNFPEDHPAREMQDTFFIERNPDVLMRTQTSTVQIRVMETQHPPIRILSPGRVYRNEVISARAHCIFHQIEGLYVNKNVSFKELKETVYYFATAMFGKETKLRFRPSFFPFTEPSAEVDISCLICHGKGCNVCKYSGWVEIMGCGMVDPAVLENCKIDSKEYTGFAFGMGLERITMLHYQIKDLRLFFENDVRFLQQFNALI